MKQDLHDRLVALSDRIDATRATLEQKNRWHHGHHLSAGELKARYAFLQKELERDIDDLETHGHHVSVLERNVHQWMHALEL